MRTARGSGASVRGRSSRSARRPFPSITTDAGRGRTATGILVQWRAATLSARTGRTACGGSPASGGRSLRLHRNHGRSQLVTQCGQCHDGWRSVLINASDGTPVNMEFPCCHWPLGTSGVSPSCAERVGPPHSTPGAPHRRRALSTRKESPHQRRSGRGNPPQTPDAGSLARARLMPRRARPGVLGDPACGPQRLLLAPALLL